MSDRTIGRTLMALYVMALAMSAIAAEPPWKRLDGAKLRNAFNNMELSDNTHFSYRFHPDGRFDGTELNRKVLGTWRTTAHEVCWNWIRPPGNEECYTVERHGHELRGSRGNFDAWWGKVVPLKANTR